MVHGGCSSLKGVDSSAELCFPMTMTWPEGTAWSCVRRGLGGLRKGCAPESSGHGTAPQDSGNTEP